MIRTFGRQMLGELLKARRRSLLYGVLLVQWFFCILPLTIGIAGWRNENLRAWAVDWVSYPGCLWHSLGLMQYAVGFCVAIAAAALVGGEYGAGTWKMVLPRTPLRYRSLLAKYLTTIVLSNGALWGGALIALVAGWAGSRLLGVPFFTPAGVLHPGEVARAEVFFLLEFVLMGAVAILTVVLTRSFVGGVLLAIAGPTLMRLLVFLPLGWLFPMWNLDRLEVRLFSATHFSVPEVVSAVGTDHSLATNLASVLGFSLLFLFLAAWLFERRDMVAD